MFRGSEMVTIQLMRDIQLIELHSLLEFIMVLHDTISFFFMDLYFLFGFFVFIVHFYLFQNKNT